MDINPSDLANSILQQSDQTVLRRLASALEGIRQQPPVPRTGLVEAAIGANFTVPFKVDGKLVEVSMTVRDVRLFPNARKVLRCLNSQCVGREWRDVTALAADHLTPDAYAKKAREIPAFRMVDTREFAHVIAFFSTDLVEPNDPLSQIVGLLSGATWEPRQ